MGYMTLINCILYAVYRIPLTLPFNEMMINFPGTLLFSDKPPICRKDILVVICGFI